MSLVSWRAAGLCGILFAAGVVAASGPGSASDWGSAIAGKPETAAAGEAFKAWEAARARSEAAWEKMPLGTVNVMFITRERDGGGAAERRPTNRFRQGEPLVTHVEPVGYAWMPASGGTFKFGIAADLVITSKSGEELARKTDFGVFPMTANGRKQDFTATFTVTPNGFKPGDYVLRFNLRDLNSPKTTSVVQDFTIVE